MKRFFCYQGFHKKLPLFPGIIIVALFLLFACKSKPLPVPEPVPEIIPFPPPALVFTGLEAKDPNLFHLSFSLNIENPFPFAGRVKIESWQAEINGKKADSGFYIDFPEARKEFAEIREFPIQAAPSQSWEKTSSSSIPLKLNMDVASLVALGLAPADDYDVRLILALEFSADLPAYKSNDRKAAAESFPQAKLEVSGNAAFPGVRPPVFSITSIAVIKAELINTRFRVGLKIDNPNPFPVELSAFKYELYGNGRLWADGNEKNILKVNKKSALTGNLFLIMNFINMKRDLLDQIINLEDVNYRFAGEVQVSTGVDYLPRFKTGFDMSGYSVVLER